MKPNGEVRDWDDAATIDHLHPRGDPERGKHAGIATHVLACKKCNNLRDQKRIEAMPIEQLHALSKRYSGSARGSES